MTQPILKVSNLDKSFTMHLQNGLHMPVMHNVDFDLSNGECVVLAGPSGVGKSTLLKLIYGNYAADMGDIELLLDGEYVNLVHADPRLILHVRRTKIGYVSQFLSAIPRVSALDLVAEVAQNWGHDKSTATQKAGTMLDRLNIPERLWHLPPATFSGGEQQRVNIARGFMGEHEVLLLDEPTASLDAKNRFVVLDMIEEKKKTGTAMLGIFHDADTRQAVATREIDVTHFAVAA